MTQEQEDKYRKFEERMAERLNKNHEEGKTSKQYTEQAIHEELEKLKNET